MNKASIIIPTYGRSQEVLNRTVRSIFNSEICLADFVQEIIVIDQNDNPLNFQELVDLMKKNQFDLITLQAIWPLGATQAKNLISTFAENSHYLIHLKGLRPSVTKSKNFGAQFSRGDILIFFDDDIEVWKGNIDNQIKIHQKLGNLGVLGGREVIVPTRQGRGQLKNFFVYSLEFFFKNNKDEKKYLFQGHYVGRVHPTSLMFNTFEFEGIDLISVDTIRGCNASVKKVHFDLIQGFDEGFQGNALREETDFCLRLLAAGMKNYYSSNFVIYHYRQPGGCNNLSQTYSSLISKFENELKFQQKHFFHQKTFYFLFRLIPIMLENIRTTFGLSFFLWVQFGWKFSCEKRKKNFNNRSNL